MKPIAQILSWLLLALFLVGTFGLYGMNPNLVGPSSIIPLLPFATALFVFHFGAPRWFVWVAFCLNVLVAIGGLAIAVVALVYPSPNPVAAALVGFVLFVLVAVNVWVLSLYLGRKRVAQAT